MCFEGWLQKNNEIFTSCARGNELLIMCYFFNLYRVGIIHSLTEFQTNDDEGHLERL